MQQLIIIFNKYTMQAPLVDVEPHYLVDLFNWVWFIFLIAVIIGVVSKPAIYDYISFLVKVLVSLFLMYKFNDFRTLGVFTELDKRICFMAGTNLFLITCGDYVNKAVELVTAQTKKLIPIQ